MKYAVTRLKPVFFKHIKAVMCQVNHTKPKKCDNILSPMYHNWHMKAASLGITEKAVVMMMGKSRNLIYWDSLMNHMEKAILEIRYISGS